MIRSLRKSLNTKKMGHIGTLDPFASGLMVIATEQSTKLIPLLEGARKEYIFEVMLNGKSDSLDTDTPITATSMTGYIDRSDDEIVSFLLSEKTQIPPRYSALHIDGKRAYDRARDGEIFKIEPRTIEVHAGEVLARKEKSLTLRIILSSGGYVRSFAPVIGAFLGVEGGYLSSLRRTRIFTDYGALDISSHRGRVLTYRELFHDIPQRMISPDLEQKLQEGRIIRSDEVDLGEIPDGYIFLANQAETFVSLCRKENITITIYKNNVGEL